MKKYHHVMASLLHGRQAAIVSVIVATLFTASAFALEVDREVIPRITLGGRVITTLDAVNLDSDASAKGKINPADSSLLLRFDKRMFHQGTAGAVVGFKEEANGDKGDVRIHELHTFYRARDFDVLLGRTRLFNTVIELPLLRDDDFLTYSHVGNASSNEEYDQLYANQLRFDWFVDKKIQRIGLWTGTRINEAAIAAAPDGFDSMGLGYVYQQSEELRYVKRLRHAGLLLDRQKVTTASGSQWLNAVIAGVEFNLNRNPQANWSMALQAIANQGVDGVLLSTIVNGATDAVASRAAAKANAYVAALRYTARPHLLTRWQAALNVAYKDYSDLADATQWSLAPTFVYRIGQGVDLVAQAKYTDYSAGMGGGTDTIMQLGISFSLEALFNDTIGKRDSILNLEHGYIH